MSESPRWVHALAVVLLVQVMLTFGTRIAPTLAPTLLPAMGWPTSGVGLLSTLTSVAAIAVMLVGTPLVRAFGAMASMQWALVSNALGVLCFAVPSVPAAVVGSVLIGLSYGPIAAGAPELLQRVAPPGHRNLLFSVKQSGVPLAAVGAGLLLPPLAVAWGLRPTLVIATALSLGAVALVALMRRGRPDVGQVPPRSVRAHLASPGALYRPLTVVWRTPALRPAVLAGAVLGAGQSVWFTFFISHLVVALHWSLVAAGAAFAVMQVASVAARPAAGWLSDRLHSPRAVLQALALLSGALTCVLAFTGPDTPAAAVWLLAVLAGCTVSSWNGVHIAEVARLAPEDQVAEAAAGGSLLVFFGLALGSALFGVALALGASYQATYGAAGLLTGAASLALARRRPPAGALSGVRP